MNRRQYLRFFSGLSLISLAGCSGRTETNETATSTPSPTPTPEPEPAITSVDVTEYPEPRGPNRISVIVHFENIKSENEYQFLMTLSSDSWNSETKWGIQSKYGFVAPLAGTELNVPEDIPTETQTVEYTLRLLENGEEVDRRIDEFEYE